MRRAAVVLVVLLSTGAAAAACGDGDDPIEAAMLTQVQQLRDAALSGDATTAREQLHALEGSVEQNRDRGILTDGHAAEILDAIAAVDLLLADAIEADALATTTTTATTTPPDDDDDDGGEGDDDGGHGKGHGRGPGGKHDD